MDEKIGATGKFPYGKLTDNDEGELKFRVGADRETETVLIDFGKPVMSLGMRPEHAENLARLLLKKAEEARRKPKQT